MEDVWYVFAIQAFSQNSFRNSPKVSNSLDLDQVEKIVRSDVDPNSLQRLSADDSSQQSISHDYEGELHGVTLYFEVMF